MGLTDEAKSIKHLRSGDLLIQYAKEKHETTLLKLKNFCGLKCKVAPHSSLKISKGIVGCPAPNKQSCQHILEFMREQDVTDVRRISVFRDGVKKPNNTFVFTFNTPVLLSVVIIGFIRAKIDAYIYQSKTEGKDQESIQSSTMPDPGYRWESDNVKIRYHKREPRGQPCPSMTTRHQQTDVHESITKQDRKA